MRLFWWRRPIHSKGARTAAASATPTPMTDEAARPALLILMSRAAHAVESKAKEAHRVRVHNRI
jgi:hypothetical protein